MRRRSGRQRGSLARALLEGLVGGLVEGGGGRKVGVKWRALLLACGLDVYSGRASDWSGRRTEGLSDGPGRSRAWYVYVLVVVV